MADVDTRTPPKVESAPESEVGLRLIIGFKLALGIVYGCVAIAVFALRHRDFSALADRLQNYVWLDTQSPVLNGLAERLSDNIATALAGITPKFLVTVSIGTSLYAALELVEAWGLHMRRRWAEWLTVVATALLLFPELREIAKVIWRGHEPVKLAVLVGVFIINVLIVAYLVRSRGLFDAVAARLG